MSIDYLVKELEAPMPFKWKAQSKPFQKGPQKVCSACAYINAAQVMHRLNSVFGPMGWAAKYEILDESCEMDTDRNGEIRHAFTATMDCTIQVYGEWSDPSQVSFSTGAWVSSSKVLVEKSDTGVGRSDTFGGAIKAAKSDAIKRAARHLGIGYFLEFIPKEDRPCLVSQKGYFVAWADDGKRDPEVERELQKLVDSFALDFGISLDALVQWMGPREQWSDGTLQAFRNHHRKLTQEKQTNPREEAGDSRSPDAPASSSSTDDKFDPFDPKQPEWLLEYPLLRGETQAMVRAWEKAGMDWRDIETEAGKKLIHLSSQEVRKFFSSIRKTHATKG